MIVGTPNGNKSINRIYVGTSFGNKKIIRAWVGTANGNKKVFSGAINVGCYSQYGYNSSCTANSWYSNSEKKLEGYTVGVGSSNPPHSGFKIILSEPITIETFSIHVVSNVTSQSDYSKVWHEIELRGPDIYLGSKKIYFTNTGTATVDLDMTDLAVGKTLKEIYYSQISNNPGNRVDYSIQLPSGFSFNMNGDTYQFEIPDGISIPDFLEVENEGVPIPYFSIEAV